jgi:hypothetical protein
MAFSPVLHHSILYHQVRSFDSLVVPHPVLIWSEIRYGSEEPIHEDETGLDGEWRVE